MPELYPPQKALVAQCLAACPGRIMYFLNADTGCGKTPMAITVMQARPAERVLIVCPAMVRSHWAKQLDIWWPGHVSVGLLEVGRKRKLNSAAGDERRAQAYSASIQIVSYDLLGEVESTGWDWIVFDEMHHLSSPRSKQSKLAFALCERNPQSHLLGLTATMASTHPFQIWNLLRTFWPKKWGQPTSSGQPNWFFCSKYMETVTNEYGTSFVGVSTRRLDELTAEIAKVAGRLTREDLGDFLPEFDLRLFDASHGPVPAAQIWLRDLVGSDSKKLAVFCYYRETAAMLAQELKADLVITGEEAPMRRLELLERFRQEGGLMVCTMSSVKEGISLTWLDEYAMVEWITSPGQMLQFLGRFSRLDQNGRRSPLGRIAVGTNVEEQNRAWKLLGRIEALNKLTRAGASSKKLENLFNEASTEEMFQADLDKLILGFIDPDDFEEVIDG